MKTLLDVTQVAPRDRLEFWHTTISENFMPIHHKNIGESPFVGKIEAVDFGILQIHREKVSSIRSEATAKQIRQYYNPDYVLAELVLSGEKAGAQSGNCFRNGAGDFMIYDGSPAVSETSSSYSALLLKIKRSSLEKSLGALPLYAGLTVRKNQASSILMRSYIRNLIRLSGSLNGRTGEQASSIVIDLMIGSIAERLCQEQPASVAGTLLMQRAKAYVEANLGDPTLDAPQLAVAMGMSLRRLQQIFHEHNQHVSDWIWLRRLAMAASRLSNPGSMFISIGMIAYQCGFVSQSHFTNRFKKLYGMPPREYREKHMIK